MCSELVQNKKKFKRNTYQGLENTEPLVPAALLLLVWALAVIKQEPRARERVSSPCGTYRVIKKVKNIKENKINLRDGPLRRVRVGHVVMAVFVVKQVPRAREHFSSPFHPPAVHLDPSCCSSSSPSRVVWLGVRGGRADGRGHASDDGARSWWWSVVVVVVV